jgi:hypothetical protein
MIIIFFGFLTNLVGIFINPVSMLIAIPFTLYVFNFRYRWGFLLFLSYYFGLFKMGPFLLPFEAKEIPLLIKDEILSITVYSFSSWILYCFIILTIKRIAKKPG